MSYGYVVCSICKREVGQEGGGKWKPGPQPPRRWFHRIDGSDLCEGGRVEYGEQQPQPQAPQDPQEER